MAAESLYPIPKAPHAIEAGSPDTHVVHGAHSGAVVVAPKLMLGARRESGHGGNSFALDPERTIGRALDFGRGIVATAQRVAGAAGVDLPMPEVLRPTTRLADFVTDPGLRASFSPEATKIINERLGHGRMADRETLTRINSLMGEALLAPVRFPKKAMEARFRVAVALERELRGIGLMHGWEPTLHIVPAQDDWSLVRRAGAVNRDAASVGTFDPSYAQSIDGFFLMTRDFLDAGDIQAASDLLFRLPETLALDAEAKAEFDVQIWNRVFMLLPPSDRAAVLALASDEDATSFITHILSHAASETNLSKRDLEIYCVIQALGDISEEKFEKLFKLFFEQEDCHELMAELLSTLRIYGTDAQNKKNETAYEAARTGLCQFYPYHEALLRGKIREDGAAVKRGDAVGEAYGAIYELERYFEVRPKARFTSDYQDTRALGNFCFRKLARLIRDGRVYSETIVHAVGMIVNQFDVLELDQQQFIAKNILVPFQKSFLPVTADEEKLAERCDFWVRSYHPLQSYTATLRRFGVNPSVEELKTIIRDEPAFARRAFGQLVEISAGKDLDLTDLPEIKFWFLLPVEYRSSRFLMEWDGHTGAISLDKAIKIRCRFDQFEALVAIRLNKKGVDYSKFEVDLATIPQGYTFDPSDKEPEIIAVYIEVVKSAEAIAYIDKQLHSASTEEINRGLAIAATNPDLFWEALTDIILTNSDNTIRTTAMGLIAKCLGANQKRCIEKMIAWQHAHPSWTIEVSFTNPGGATKISRVNIKSGSDPHHFVWMANSERPSIGTSSKIM